jgi:hypothetical protein
LADVCSGGQVSSAVSHADEWLRDSHEDPEEEEDVKSGEMRCVGEVFQKTPDGTDRKSPTKTPEHRLNDDGALKVVGLFGDVETDDCERADEGQCREYGEKVGDEASGMTMMKYPLRDEEKDKIDNHGGKQAVYVAASGF